MAKDFGIITGAGVVTVPASTTTAAQGALEANNEVVIGTDLNLLKVGDWIVDITNQERRSVKKVVSDTKLVLSKGFSNTTALGTLNFVEQEASFAVFMELTASGSILVDGVAVTDGSVSFGNNNPSGSGSKLIRPRFVNPQAGSCTYNIEYFDNNYGD